MSKIIYDKTFDYLSYYIGNQNKSESLKTDNLDDYTEMLNVENYEKEKNNTNTRLFPFSSYYDIYNSFFDNPTFITDNIYLGSAWNAASFNTLKELNITLIINVAREIRNYFPDDFEYVKYNLYDDNKQSIEKYLEISYNHIINHQKTNPGNILIHCYMGASRSVSLVIYYLMKNKTNPQTKKLYTFDEALEFLKNKRPIVNPTFRFTKDLAKSMFIK